MTHPHPPTAGITSLLADLRSVLHYIKAYLPILRVLAPMGQRIGADLPAAFDAAMAQHPLLAELRKHLAARTATTATTTTATMAHAAELLAAMASDPCWHRFEVTCSPGAHAHAIRQMHASGATDPASYRVVLAGELVTHLLAVHVAMADAVVDAAEGPVTGEALLQLVELQLAAVQGFDGQWHSLIIKGCTQATATLLQASAAQRNLPAVPPRAPTSMLGGLDHASLGRLAHQVVRQAKLGSAKAAALGRVVLGLADVLASSSADGTLAQGAADLVARAYAADVVHQASRTAAHRGLEHDGHVPVRLEAQAAWAGPYLAATDGEAVRPGDLAEAIFAAAERRPKHPGADPVSVLAARVLLAATHGMPGVSRAVLVLALACSLAAHHAFCWRALPGALFAPVHDRRIPLARLQQPSPMVRAAEWRADPCEHADGKRWAGRQPPSSGRWRARQRRANEGGGEGHSQTRASSGCARARRGTCVHARG